MTDHSPTANYRAVRQAYEALAAGDINALLDRLANDIDWHEARGLRLTGGDHRGRDAVAKEVLGPFSDAISDLRVTPSRFLGEGDVVVVLGQYTGVGQATGVEVDVAFAHLWELDDGIVRRFTQYTDTALLNRALSEATRAAT